MEPVIYRIDADDRIVYVNAAWSLDPATGLAGGQHVLGRRLWDCFADPSTQELYVHMVRRSRQGRVARVEYRCDTAELRRWFEMAIVAVGDGMVEFSSRLRRQEQRAPVALLATAQARDDRFVRMCSWCQRIAMPDGGWTIIEGAVRELGLLAQETLPRLTHGICEECADRLRRSIAAS